MPPGRHDRPIRWWLPLLGIAAFAALLGVWIAVNTWDFTGHSSPDCYSPWEDHPQLSGDGSEDLAANFTPQWTKDGQAVLVSITRGFYYADPRPGISMPELTLYEGSIYNIDTKSGKLRKISTVRGPVEIDASPQISPDGSQYAHVTSRYLDGIDRNFDIAISAMDGPETARITQDAKYIGKTDTHPEWSPDGNTIAFIKRGAHRENLNTESPISIDTIYTVPAAGGEPKILFPTAEQLRTLANSVRYPAVIGPPAWSPDGRHVAFKTHHMTFDDKDTKDYIRHESVLIVEQETSGAKEIARTNRQEASIGGPVTWSPNGQALTFIRGYAANSVSPKPQLDLISVTLDGTENKIGTFDDDVPAWGIRDFEWSPSGDRILISFGDAWLAPEVDASVLVATPDGTTVQWLRNFGAYASWSPDGTEIAALSGYHMRDGTGGRTQHKVIRIATRSADGSDERIILEAKIVENPD